MSYIFITPFQKISSLAQLEVHGGKEVGESCIISSTLFIVAILPLPCKDRMAWPVHSTSKVSPDFISHCIMSCAHTLAKGIDMQFTSSSLPQLSPKTASLPSVPLLLWSSLSMLQPEWPPKACIWACPTPAQKPLRDSFITRVILSCVITKRVPAFITKVHLLYWYLTEHIRPLKIANYIQHQSLPIPLNSVFLGAKAVPNAGQVLKYCWKEIFSGFCPMQCFHGRRKIL